MRALTDVPGQANSARVEDVAEPPASDGTVRAQQPDDIKVVVGFT
jgi:hypothetical protein